MEFSILTDGWIYAYERKGDGGNSFEFRKTPSDC
jgi:hypothetical protein